MQKVMIAEDDLLVADLLAEVLVGGGYEVCGIARTVAEGIELNQRYRPDLAVLDLRLAHGGLGTDIAAGFISEHRPGVLYATGNRGQLSLTRSDGEACLGKPYGSDDLIRALAIVEEIVNTGMASKPYPKGFQVLEETSVGDAESNAVNDESIEIRRLRRQQAALAVFGSFALAESDLGTVLTEAARVCAEGLDVPFCKVWRYREVENDLLFEAGVGWREGVIGRVVSRADESSPEGRAFVTGKPVICGTLCTESNFMLPSFYAEYGIVSSVDVIIRKEGQPYGVLEVDSPVQHDYEQHDIDFLTGFANVLAEAFNAAKRNASLLHANIALQTAVARMEGMVADRDRLILAKSILLAEKNRLLEDKSVLAQELQHRVRSNLQLVFGMLSKQLNATSDPSGKEGLGAIARKVMTLAQVYDHLLGAGLSRKIDFGAYLSALCESIESLQTEKHADVALTCRAEPIILDLDCVTALGLVTSELISNSYEHAFPAGKGTISVSVVASKTDDEGTICCADNGAGFMEKGDSKRHGIGLVRRLMQQVGGSATLRNGKGTEWQLTFPVQKPTAAAES
jgi:two-component sensor histidine kinase